VKLALKIDVDTFRGTREGVPALLAMLERHGAGATFLFSLGPDHTGRAIKRALRPGFMQKVGRTSVLSHYGVKTLLYGTLLPGPDIGKRCADVMRDADVRREAKRIEEKRKAERRQQWTERRRNLRRQDQELRDVEQKVREETEPAFAAQPVRMETPRMRLFDNE